MPPVVYLLGISLGSTGQSQSNRPQKALVKINQMHNKTQAHGSGIGTGRELEDDGRDWRGITGSIVDTIQLAYAYGIYSVHVHVCEIVKELF